MQWFLQVSSVRLPVHRGKDLSSILTSSLGNRAGTVAGYEQRWAHTALTWYCGCMPCCMPGCICVWYMGTAA